MRENVIRDKDSGLSRLKEETDFNTMDLGEAN